MSSRGSSKSSSKSGSNDIIKQKPIISNTTLMIMYHFLVVLYIVNLEGKDCRCIRDWRHDFLKYYSIAMVFWGIITIALKLKGSTDMLVVVMRNIIMFSSLISIWALYTYIGDLDKTQCKCAVVQQKDMHYFLYLWRYIPVGFLIIAFIMIIVNNINSM